MKIVELLEARKKVDPIAINLRIAAIASQIAGMYKDTGTKKPMSLTAFLDRINADKKADFIISSDEIKDMATKSLKDIIAIEGNKVRFIGQESGGSGAIKPNQSTTTLEKMAKRAGKKRGD